MSNYPQQQPPAYQAQPGYQSNPNDLDAPLYGATIGQAVTRFFKKYATFSGRASRSEYWWWALVSFVVGAVLGGINGATVTADPNNMMSAFGPAYWALMLFVVATLVPNIAVSIRRLHDTDRSGWWILISLVPFIGGIVLLIFNASGPNPNGARFDRNAGAGFAGPGYAGPGYAG